MIATTLVKLENTTDTRVNLEFLALFIFYMLNNLFANTIRMKCFYVRLRGQPQIT